MLWDQCVSDWNLCDVTLFGTFFRVRSMRNNKKRMIQFAFGFSSDLYSHHGPMFLGIRIDLWNSRQNSIKNRQKSWSSIWCRILSCCYIQWSFIICICLCTVKAISNSWRRTFRSVRKISFLFVSKSKNFSLLNRLMDDWSRREEPLFIERALPASISTIPTNDEPPPDYFEQNVVVV